MRSFPRATHSSGVACSASLLCGLKMWSFQDEKAQSVGLGARVAVIARSSSPVRHYLAVGTVGEAEDSYG